jgi:hypothetical protein
MVSGAMVGIGEMGGKCMMVAGIGGTYGSRGTVGSGGGDGVCAYDGGMWVCAVDVEKGWMGAYF